MKTPIFINYDILNVKVKFLFSNLCSICLYVWCSKSCQCYRKCIHTYKEATHLNQNVTCTYKTITTYVLGNFRFESLVKFIKLLQFRNSFDIKLYDLRTSSVALFAQRATMHWHNNNSDKIVNGANGASALSCDLETETE